MGKNKPSKRFRGQRPDPTGLVTDQDVELLMNEGPEADIVPATITNIVEQLNDPSKEERAFGCQHIARVVCKPKAIEMLLKQDVIKIVSPLFLDSCVDVQKSALGALRNMSMYGEQKVCDMMVKKDVLTPLTVVIKKFGQDFNSTEKATNHDVSVVILLEAVELMSNLCENNDRALQLFNKEKILRILLPLLNSEICGYPLSNAVAHCLHVVSENNTDVSKVCRQADVLSTLMNIVTSSHSSIDAVLFKSRIIGVILNLTEVDFSPHYDRFIQVIGEVLDMDCLPLISLLVEAQAGTVENDKTDVDLSQQDVDKLIAAQRVNLEMLANMCCNDDEWEQMEEDGADELGDDLVDASGDAGIPEEEAVASLCLPSEIHSAFEKYSILTKILKKAYPLDQAHISSLEPLQFGKILLQRFEDLQARALLCLSNMIGVVYKASQTQNSPIVPIWTELYALAKSYEGNNEDYMWAVTSAMRSVMQKMSEIDQQQILALSQADLEFMVNIGTVSSNPETQINVIRMVSTVGCVLALKPEHQHLVKTIGEILLQVCRVNEDVVVVSETLDSLFDVFKEDETDPVAKEIDLVQHLKTIQTSFKVKVSKERKKLGQSYGIVMMARSNLAAFLQYKKARHL